MLSFLSHPIIYLSMSIFFHPCFDLNSHISCSVPSYLSCPILYLSTSMFWYLSFNLNSHLFFQLFSISSCPTSTNVCFFLSLSISIQVYLFSIPSSISRRILLLSTFIFFHLFSNLNWLLSFTISSSLYHTIPLAIYVNILVSFSSS